VEERVGPTYDALVEAAGSLMDAGGLEAVTLREVGHAVGLSHNAPYKHFQDKQALLAAVAARELTYRSAALDEVREQHDSDAETLRAALHGYVAWALARPVRFKLVYGPWTRGSPELDEAALAARSRLVKIVAGAQDEGYQPKVDPERLMALLLALAHGAVDLALSGHLSNWSDRAGPDDLVDDLLAHLAVAAS
jgi:AcrR family transcriptional regulator